LSVYGVIITGIRGFNGRVPGRSNSGNKGDDEGRGIFRSLGGTIQMVWRFDQTGRITKQSVLSSMLPVMAIREIGSEGHRR
jgi:hypothetical protein